MADQTLDEELEVLNSIYAESLVSFGNGDRFTLQLAYPSSESPSHTIEVSFSSTLYPGDHRNVEVALKSSTYYIDSEFATSILDKISTENPGGNILFQLFEDLKEYLANHQDLPQRDFDMSGLQDEVVEEVVVDPAEFHRRIAEREQRAKERGGRTLLNGKVINIIHGPNVVEQRSTFQAHLAQVSSMEEVEYVRYTLLLDKKVAAATHNIMAYRFTDAATGIVHHDCDDDGECAAGGRLAEMVRLMGASNVVVVVSRWFGGVLMGPSRFKYICNTARDLMEEHGFCKDDKRSKKT